MLVEQFVPTSDDPTSGIAAATPLVDDRHPCPKLVTEHDRTLEPPFLDAEERQRGPAEDPHVLEEANHDAEPQQPVGDPLAVGRLSGEVLVGVKGVVIAGQVGEGLDVLRGDRPGSGLVYRVHLEVLVEKPRAPRRITVAWTVTRTNHQKGSPASEDTSYYVVGCHGRKGSWQRTAGAVTVYITGVGEVDPRPQRGRSAVRLVANAVDLALADAEVPVDEVDGVLTGYSLVEPHPMFADTVAEYLGVRPSWCTTINSGGATGCALIRQAAAALTTGAARTVVVAWGDSRGSTTARSEVVERLASFAHPEFEVPHGPTIVSLYALVASRYLHERDASPADLAQVAVTFRENARKNPRALMRDPITVEDVLSSPVIASPLRLLDCCLISDYGGALVLTTDPGNMRYPPVRVLGSGEAHLHEHLSQAGSLEGPGISLSAQRAFDHAGVSVQNIDVAQLYDSFTVTVLLQVEALGLSEPGASGRDFAAGRFDPDGEVPLNTNGGMLSALNGGIHHVIEAVRQLQGRAMGQQVTDPRLAFVHGIGGVLSSHCSLVLGTEEDA